MKPRQPRGLIIRCLPPLLLSLAVIAVYLPGLPGDFLFDDYGNILDNEALRIEDAALDSLLRAALSGDAGPLGRPLAMLSFALNHLWGGLDPAGYKRVNITIHLVNTLLLYLLAGVLLRGLFGNRPGAEGKYRVPAFTAALIWGLHPINLGAVLYVVQRMTSLAALFMILGLLLYCLARERMVSGERGWAKYLLTSALMVVPAVLCKENGVLLFVFAAVIELGIFRLRASTRGGAMAVRTYHLLFLLLPVAAGLLLLVLDPGRLLGGYAYRDFTLLQRLLTESRVLWFYLGLLLLPRPWAFGLYHDDFALSTGLLQPPTTLLAVAALAALLVFALKGLRRHPVVAFAILWFLAGHLIESTLLPLELIYEHRNYLAAFGPILAVTGGAFHHLRAGKQRRLAMLALGAWCLLSVSVTMLRAHEWRNIVTAALMTVDHHPRSARARYQLGTAYMIAYLAQPRPDYLEEMRRLFKEAAELDPGTALPLFSLVHLAAMQGREPEPEVLAELHRRLRHGKVEAVIASAFYHLNQCIAQGKCRFSPGLLLSLYGDVLSNPAVWPEERADILVLLGQVYARLLQDHAAAVRVLADAVSLRPDEWAWRLLLIDEMIRSGETERARAEIAALRVRLEADRLLPLRRERLEELERIAARLAPDH